MAENTGEAEGSRSRPILSDRRVLTEDTEGIQEARITSRVPQGSVLGPELWNVLYSGVLDLELPVGCESTAYADDYALQVEGTTEGEVKARAEAAHAGIQDWMAKNGLSLAPEKTEAIVVTGGEGSDRLSQTWPGTSAPLGGRSSTWGYGLTPREHSETTPESRQPGAGQKPSP